MPDSRLTELELHILLALAPGPLHGYGIILDIEARTGTGSDLRSGTLYAALRRLRDDGLVEHAEAPAGAVDARRRYLRLTSQGRVAAAAELERLREIVAEGRERHLLRGRSS